MKAWTLLLLAFARVVPAAHAAESAPVARPAEAAWTAGSDTGGTRFDPGRAGFSVEADGHTIGYRTFALFLLPGETFDLRPGQVWGRVDGVEVQSDEIVCRQRGRAWSCRAPRDPGTYALRIVSHDIPDTMRWNIFVKHPSRLVKDGYLNGYHIGDYPKVALRGLEVYRPPKGFIEVTEENRRTLVSPHFRLEQFLCKQEGGFPKYLVLDEKLLIKLELILERVNGDGIRAQTLHIMSGYRTPQYNRAIQNVQYSRHIYGDAADVFIDVDEDGYMDDLNGDGVGDIEDALLLRDRVADLAENGVLGWLLGGLAAYRKNPVHGPFVHVDARGFRARWGVD